MIVPNSYKFGKTTLVYYQKENANASSILQVEGFFGLFFRRQARTGIFFRAF